MIPSRGWFPTTLAARAAWFANFVTQFTIVAAGLGLASKAAGVEADNEDFQAMAATRMTVESFRAGVADYVREMTEGAVGSPHPVFPVEGFDAPPHNVPAGIFQRLDELRTLIMAQPTYTVGIGNLLGIEIPPGESIAPETIQPEIDLTAAVHGYLYSVVVSGRYESDQWEVWARPSGGGGFTLVKTSTGKSTDVTYLPTGEIPAPVVLEVYVQLKRKDSNYGLPSDIALVTVNP